MSCCLYLLIISILPQIHWAYAQDGFDGPFLYQVTQPIEHGEGPTWDYRKSVLYFVDLYNPGKILSYDYFTKELHSIQLNGDVTPVVPSKLDPDLLIVGVNRSIVAVRWDGKSDRFESMKVLLTVAEDKPTSRFNDGKADDNGRLWFGTMGFEDSSGKISPNDGTLFKIANEIAMPQSMISPVNISNGLAWNKANDKFYYIDSPTRKIVQYDFDNHKGEISNKKVIFDLESAGIQNCTADGMTIDKDDKLWIALYGGGSVIKVDPNNGMLLGRIPIPAERVTSVAWGGPKLDILFVTTSRYILNDSQKSAQPGAGSVYAISNLGTSGFPANEANFVVN